MLLEIPGWLPGAFIDWMPWLQAVVLGVATLVQEDVPTVTAALLASAGMMSWQAGILGRFLGIWFGDALLYLVARGFGHRLLTWRWIRRRVTEASIEQSQRWFSQRGVWLLVSSRFIPGMRLPTYLAAGFLRVPFPTFLGVTGGVVAVWTLGIFGLTEVFGSVVGDSLERWKGNGLLLVVAAAVLVLAVKGIPRLLSPSAFANPSGVGTRVAVGVLAVVALLSAGRAELPSSGLEIPWAITAKCRQPGNCQWRPDWGIQVRNPARTSSDEPGVHGRGVASPSRRPRSAFLAADDSL